MFILSTELRFAWGARELESVIRRLISADEAVVEFGVTQGFVFGLRFFYFSSLYADAASSLLSNRS